MSNMEKVFGVGGWLSKSLDNYRPRPGQVALAKVVEAGIHDRQHVVGEGPTGTGKSFAAAFPAAIHAVTTGEKVVYATANITLQEQLINKDLPLIADVLAKEGSTRPVKFALLKGMGNFLCMSELDKQRKSNKLVKPDWLKGISAWADNTETGDRSDLMLDYPEWHKVSISGDECPGKECRFYQQCWAIRARRLAKEADIVVANYHLVFTDFMVRAATMGKAGLLPEYGVLIMDEAHEAAGIAMDFQGFQFTRWTISSLLAGNKTEQQLGMRYADDFLSALGKYEDRANKDKILREPFPNSDGEKLVDILKRNAQDKQQESEQLRGQADSAVDSEKRGEYREEAAKAAKRAGAMLERADQIGWALSGDHPSGYVLYTEEMYDKKARQYRGKLCCKVVDVQPFFRDNVFDDKVAILTSATLTTHGNFEFIAGELGLEDGEYASLIAPNPFNPERCAIIIPEDAPEPWKKEHQVYVADTIELIAKSIGGKTMALFTSWKNLNATRERLERTLPGTHIIAQGGDLPKAKMIEQFKRASNAVLLGTASFWQGVDIPGEALSVVVIDKFPFLSPTDPVLKFMESKLGRKTFAAYSIPKAIISLKQGVGRLIRTEEDYGCVVICDSRYHSKQYGVQFNHAFPQDAPLGDDVEQAVDFLAGLR